MSNLNLQEYAPLNGTTRVATSFLNERGWWVVIYIVTTFQTFHASEFILIPSNNGKSLTYSQLKSNLKQQPLYAINIFKRLTEKLNFPESDFGNW